MNNILIVRNILISQIRLLKILFLSLLLCAGILVGCGSSGDGGSVNENKSGDGAEDALPTIDSIEDLNWDEMEWDQGKWG